MAHKCPHCGDAVQRGHSKGVQMAGGLVGALFFAAFGPMECKKCGKIRMGDFPPAVRSKIVTNSILMVVAAIALAIGVVWLLVKMRS
jgi:hypothetical protein